MSSESIKFKVPPDKSGMRLDQWLAAEMEESCSRSQISKWIDSGFVIGPDGPVKCSTKISADDEYTISIPEPELHDLLPVDLSLKILYEDKDIAVIIKPPGLAVHPGNGEDKITLLNGIYYIWQNLKPTPDNFRPGIVHRLDSSTEGVMVIALNSNALRLMSDQFKNREIEKYYSAWLLAAPPHAEGRIELPIKRHPVDRLKMTVSESGRMAITNYKIQKIIQSKKGRKYCHADINIETGRTHQIRVHMAHAGCPVVGDPLYSRSHKEFEKFGLLLLARRIIFNHPVTGKKMDFEINLPDRFLEFEIKCANF